MALTALQKGAIRFADTILKAPQSHLDKEPPEDLIGAIDIALKALNFMGPGVGARIIELENLKARTQKLLQPEMNLS